MTNEADNGGTGTALTDTNNGAGNNTSTGTGAASGAASGQNGSGGSSNTSNKVVLPEKWQEALSEDLKNEPILKQFTDFEAMAKSLVHAQKSIGADKIVVPGKHATSDDWKQVYKRLGLPESKDKYELKAPELFAKDKEAIDQIKEIAMEAGVMPQQLQKIMDKYADMTKAFVSKQQNFDKDAQNADISNLKNEWGEKFPINLKKAQVALTKYDSGGTLKKILESTGLGNHSALIKAFAKIGESLEEDGIVGHNSGASGEEVFTPNEAQTKIGQIMSDPKDPYNDSKHPNHQRAVDDMKRIFEMAYPNKGA